MKTVLYFKGLVSFLVPAGMVMVPELTKLADTNTWPSNIKLLAILAAALLAGFSGLGSFLSTSFAQHKAEQQESENLLANPSPK